MPDQPIQERYAALTRRCDTLTARAERAEQERDQLASRLDELIEARIELSEAGHLPPAPVPGSSRRAQEIDASPDRDCVYIDVRGSHLTVTQTTGRTLAVAVNGEFVAVPDRVRTTIELAPAGESQASEPAPVEPMWTLRGCARCDVGPGGRHTDEHAAEIRAMQQASEPAAPKLAQGGIIRTNKLAIVGEQTDGCVIPAERPIDLDDRAGGQR